MELISFGNIIAFAFLLMNLNCVSIYPQESTPLCYVEFDKVGIRDFDLGDSIDEIKKANPSLNLEEIKDGIFIYRDFIAQEDTTIEGVQKKISYYFNFKDNKLKGYFFEMSTDINFFEKLAKKLSDNDFINFKAGERNYYYFARSENCFKYFRIKMEDEMTVMGGVELN